MLASLLSRCWGLAPQIRSHHSALYNLSLVLSHLSPAFPNAFISKGCCNKLPPTWWLKTTEMHSLTVLEARRPKSRCWQDQFLVESLKETPHHASFPASGGTSNPWCSLVCGPHTIEGLSPVFPQSPCVFILLLLSLIKTVSSRWIWGPFNPR